MISLLNKIRKNVVSSVWKDPDEIEDDLEVDNLIALGVLLRVVADADDRFLPQEEEKLKQVLQKYSDIREADMPIVLRSIKEASLNRIDLHSFTKEVGQNMPREAKIEVMESLFRVACIDEDLDEKEHEMIRKISGLFGLDHQEFIDAKIKVKKEFGMDTAGL